jgi:hypothetical protein
MMRPVVLIHKSLILSNIRHLSKVPAHPRPTRFPILNQPRTAAPTTPPIFIDLVIHILDAPPRDSVNDEFPARTADEFSGAGTRASGVKGFFGETSDAGAAAAVRAVVAAVGRRFVPVAVETVVAAGCEDAHFGV